MITRLMRHALIALLSLSGVLTAACADSSASERDTAAGPTAITQSPQPPPLPVVTIAPGRHMENALSPGRYFASPSSGCFWERQTSANATADGAFTRGFVGFDAAQWIVDIRSTDVAFTSNEACGTWTNRAGHGTQQTIRPGVWLVGSQVAPDLYTSSVAAGCYWERLRDFAGHADSIIARELVATAGTAFITILPGDAGFRSEAACGTWMPVSGPVSGLPYSDLQ